VLSFALLMLSLLSSLAIVWILLRNYRANALRKRLFTRRYETLLEGLNIDSKIGVFWTALLQVRWVVTHVIMVFLRELPEVQILSLLIVSWVYLGLQIAGHPYDSQIDHRVGIFGELMISSYLYFMLMLTDFHAEENPFRGAQGQGLVYIVAVSVVVNLSKFTYQIFRNLRLAWVRRQARLKYLEDLEK